MGAIKTWETGGNQSIVSGAAVQLTSSTTECRRGIVVRANAANTEVIYVGEVGVSATTGFELSAGDSVVLPVLSADEVYAISAAGTQSACFVIVQLGEAKWLL